MLVERRAEKIAAREVEVYGEGPMNEKARSAVSGVGGTSFNQKQTGASADAQRAAVSATAAKTPKATKAPSVPKATKPDVPVTSKIASTEIPYEIRLIKAAGAFDMLRTAAKVVTPFFAKGLQAAKANPMRTSAVVGAGLGAMNNKENRIGGAVTGASTGLIGANLMKRRLLGT